MSRTVVIAGISHPFAALTEPLNERGYRLLMRRDKSGYVAYLADEQVSAVIVSGEDEDWRFWTTTPKTSPATRRIPIIVVSESPEIRAQADQAGADHALTPSELTPQFIDAIARKLDAAQRDQLDCQCAEPMPPEGLLSIEKFNAGEYYEQHDRFEAMWMAETGPVRDLYRAILQVGVAYYQVTRGNYRGAHKMLLRSIQWLNILPDVCQGVDVAQLRRDAAAVRAELERLAQQPEGGFDMALLKGVRRVAPNSGS